MERGRKKEDEAAYKNTSRIMCVSDNNIVIPVSGSSSEGKGRNPGLGRGSLFSIIDDEFSRCMQLVGGGLTTHAKVAWQDMLGLKKTGIKGTVLLVCVPLVGRDACLAVAMDGGMEAVAEMRAWRACGSDDRTLASRKAAAARRPRTGCARCRRASRWAQGWRGAGQQRRQVGKVWLSKSY